MLLKLYFYLKSYIEIPINIEVINNMLRKINEGKVESDSGFSIHITGLESIKYEDNEHSIEFEWNYNQKLNKTYIYVSELKELDDMEKNYIIKNISEAIKLLDGNFEVI